MEAPEMPKNLLPRLIKNENKDKLEIRHQLTVEMFKTEINLQQTDEETKIRNVS